MIVVPVVLAFYNIYNAQAIAQQNYTKAMLANSLLAQISNNITDPAMVNSPLHQIIGKTQEDFDMLYQTHIFTYTAEFYFDTTLPKQCAVPNEPVEITESIDLACITTGHIDLILRNENPTAIANIYLNPSMVNNISLYFEGYPPTVVLVPQTPPTVHIYTKLTVEDIQGRILQVGVLP